MSRHVIPNAPGSPESVETVVGWDAPMNTFFGMCFDEAKDEPDNQVFWVGDSPCELPTIGDLARTLGGYGVELPVEVATRLGEDHAREGKRFAGRPASGLLAAMSTMFAGSEQADRISAALTGQDQTGSAV